MAIPVVVMREGWRSYVFSLLSGALLPLAFAPVNLFPLAIFLPAILFWLLLNSTPRHAFRLGYLFGLGFFGIGVSWVAVSFYRFGNMGIFLSAIATLLFVLVLSLFPAIFGWLGRRYLKQLHQTFFLLLFLPSSWVLSEWIRGWIFTGFPWLHLGNSQTDSPLAGLAPVVGVYGISWAIVFSSAMLVWICLTSTRNRIVGLVIVGALWIVSGLLTFVEWSSDKGMPLTASLIQGNVPQNLKWRPDQRKMSFDLYTRLSRERWGKDLIIWPETALPAFYHQAETFLKGLAKEASVNGNTTLLVGLPVVDATNTDNYYNSVVRIGGDNGDEQTVQFYYKSHLVPFGEYIPLKFLLGGLLDILKVPMADFSRGDKDQPLLKVAGNSVEVSICYEDVFGEEVIRGLPEASFLVNVSNDAWFGDSFAPHQHLQMARMRAMETARPMLRSTNNGVSAIIDRHGKIISTSPQFEVAVLDGVIQPQQGATPYVLTGNWSVLAGLFLVIGLCVQLARQQ